MLKRKLAALKFAWAYRQFDRDIKRAEKSGCTQAIHKARKAKRLAVHNSLSLIVSSKPAA